MATLGRHLLIACLLSTAALAAGSGENVAIDSQLPGSYEYLNVLELLNFQFDQSLNFICPKVLDVSATQTSGIFDLSISNATDSASGFECHVLNNEVVRGGLERVQPKEPSNETSQDSGPATLLDLESYYPTFFGNFSDHPLVCSLLDATIQPTNLTVRDTGYLYTILNYYKGTSRPLGEAFQLLDWKFFEKARGTYSIGLTIAPETLGCSFVKKSDKKALLALKNEILNPSAEPIRSAEPVRTPTASSSKIPSPIPSASASSSTLPSLNANETDSACFPANAKVKLYSGEFVALRDLQVGDHVLDSSNSFSQIILFTHADSEVLTEFVHIHAEDAEIVLSPSHFLYGNNRSVAAVDVQVGDVLTSVMSHKWGQSKPSKVILIEKQQQRGLYNPHTTSGNIVIFWEGDNGVLTTTYTKAVDPRLAHFLLWPLRMLTERTGKTFAVLSKPFDKGNQFWPLLLQKAKQLTQN